MGPKNLLGAGLGEKAFAEPRGAWKGERREKPAAEIKGNGGQKAAKGGWFGEKRYSVKGFRVSETGSARGGVSFRTAKAET